MAHRHIHAGTGVIIGACSVVALIAAGCGGGGGGAATSGTTSGLAVADTVSAVTAKSSSSTGGKPSAKAGGSEKAEAPNFAIDLTSTGAFGSDPQSRYVREDTREALNEANGVLCVMGQTAYDQMVNKGDYNALLDTDSCFNKEGDHGSGSSTGESSGASETANNDKAVVNVVRADASSPQTTKMWLEVSKCGPDNSGCLVSGRMVVTAGKSNANPWGLFTINYQANKLTSGVAGAAAFRGSLQATAASDALGRPLVSLVLVNKEGDVTVPPGPNQFSNLRKARALLSMDAATGDAVSGNAYVYNEERSNFNGLFSSKKEAIVAYNASNFLVSVVGGATTCYDRTKFTYSIWRYGLYNVSDGSRVARNSGFPVRSADGTHAFVGYWGLWYPQEKAAEFADGQTVTKESFGSGTGASYTVVAAPGKLIKRTRQILTLASLVSLPLEYSCYDQGCGADLGSQFQVEWNGSDIVKKAVAGQSNQSRTWVPISGSPALVLPRDYNRFWAQGLGGQVAILSSNLTGLTSVFFWQETNVTSLQSTITLYCYTRCLKPQITQAQANAGQGANGAYLPQLQGTGSPYTYVFTSSTMTLTSAGSAVTLVAGVTSVTGQNQWGFNTGALVSVALTGGNPWDTENRPEFYTWETGPNAWNKFITVREGTNGPFVTFDPPIRILYTHASVHDRNRESNPTYVSPYAGVKFQLEYTGFGQINGIPWVPSLDGTGFGRPAFPLKDGVVVDDAGKYKVKALNLEQSMTAVPVATCTAAGLTIGTFAAPADPFENPAIGARPTVTSAPAVIKGVVQ